MAASIRRGLRFYAGLGLLRRWLAFVRVAGGGSGSAPLLLGPLAYAIPGAASLLVLAQAPWVDLWFSAPLLWPPSRLTSSFGGPQGDTCTEPAAGRHWAWTRVSAG
jgi:hypothetical protein